MTFISSCKKTDKPDNGLSSKINAIISQDVLNDLQNRGMKINSGHAAPSIEGIFKFSPTTLRSPYGPSDNYYVGQVVADYKYRFYNQHGDECNMDFKSEGIDHGTGYASYLSGEGDKFTLFSQAIGTANGVDYKMVSILSGELTAGGIKDFQLAFVLTEKDGDESNDYLMPAGKGRIFYDGDYFSTSTDIYRTTDQHEGGTKSLLGSGK